MVKLSTIIPSRVRYTGKSGTSPVVFPNIISGAVRTRDPQELAMRHIPKANLFGWCNAYQDAAKTVRCTLGGSDTCYTLADLSGNGRDLVQATGSERPLYMSDQLNGKPSIQFDGSDDFLATASVTLDKQATTVYFVWKQVAWVLSHYLFGLVGSAVIRAQQTGTSPQISTDGITDTGGLSVGSFGLTTFIYGSSNRTLKINNDTSVTGTAASAGTESGAFQIANQNSALLSNISVNEILVYSAIHNPVSGDGLKVRQYLNNKYQLLLPI